MGTAREIEQGLTKSGSGTGKKRGKVKNTDRLDIFKERSRGGSADWGGVDPKWIVDVVVKITELGGACTFGLSRDGGAHSLTLLLDDSRQTLWFNGDADLAVELETVIAVLDAM